MTTPASDLSQVLNSCPAVVSIIDKQCTIVFANTGMLKFLSLPFQEVVGNKCFQLVHGTKEAIQGCPLKTMLRKKERTEVEVELVGRQYKVTVEPIFTEDGRLLGGLHIMADRRDPDPLVLELDSILSQAHNLLMGQ